MALKLDEKARFAHRALRLIELGHVPGSIAELRDFAEQSVSLDSGQGTHPALRCARGLADGTDTDLPGPTDPDYIADLLGMSWEECFAQWRENADRACEKLYPEDYAAARASIEEQIAEREEADRRMAWTGEWPAREAFLSHEAALKASRFAAGGLANVLYDPGREGFLAGEIDWDTAVIKAVLVDTGAYTPDTANHKFLSSIAAGARIATSAALTAKTITAGVADAADLLYAALTGTSIEAIVLVQSSAVGGGADVADTAQRLIAFIDTATGLPYTPSGADLNVAWDNGANRIFKL